MTFNLTTVNLVATLFFGLLAVVGLLLWVSGSIYSLCQDRRGQLRHKEVSDLFTLAMATTASTVVAATIYAATVTKQITILYALWVKRHLERGEAEPARLIQNFDVMPEVREVFEHHLDPAGVPSLAIRSVYSQRLHQLVHLDAKWTAQWVAAIFPREESLHHFRDAAWDAYLIFCLLSLQVFDTLRGEYSRAIAYIDTPSRQVQYFANSDEHLAKHLLILYWSGKLDLQVTLLTQLFEQAPGMLCEFAITFVDQSLGRTQEVDPQLLQRLQELWEWRVERAQQSIASTESLQVRQFYEIELSHPLGAPVVFATHGEPAPPL